MLINIITAIFGITVFFGILIAFTFRKVYGIVSEKKKDKAARKAAMKKYMQMHALDIEH